MRGTAHSVMLAFFAAPALAHAFTIESVATVACHEQVTSRALTQVSPPNGAQPALPSGPNRGLAQTLAFTVPADADDWTITYLIGARDNDLHGAAAADMDRLSALHNADEGQEEHCLRAPAEDDAEGDASAIQNCRRYILSQIEKALGDDEQVDFLATERVLVALRHQHQTLTLPRYPLQMGRAIHALQDSFTHTYRTTDFHQVATVFNYVDPATAPSYVPERDGFEHRSDFDRCSATSGREAGRVESAVAASAELLAAVGQDGTRSERLARAGPVLDRWLTLRPGCDASNAWCDGEEPLPKKCSATVGGPMLGLALLALRARRRSR
jgi:hypothetical protein